MADKPGEYEKKEDGMADGNSGFADAAKPFEGQKARRKAGISEDIVRGGRFRLSVFTASLVCLALVAGTLFVAVYRDGMSWPLQSNQWPPFVSLGLLVVLILYVTVKTRR